MRASGRGQLDTIELPNTARDRGPPRSCFLELEELRDEVRVPAELAIDSWLPDR